jgi:hypothetical protein
VRQIFVVGNPFGQNIADMTANFRKTAGGCLIPGLAPVAGLVKCQQPFGLACPYPAQLPEIGIESPVSIVGNERIPVPRHQTGQFCRVLTKNFGVRDLSRHLFSQELVTDAYSHVADAPGDIAKRCETSNLTFPNKPTFPFDDVQLVHHERTQANKNQDRYSEEEGKAFSYRHDFSRTVIYAAR